MVTEDLTQALHQRQYVLSDILPKTEVSTEKLPLFGGFFLYILIKTTTMKTIILLFAISIIFASCTSPQHLQCDTYKSIQAKRSKKLNKKVRGGYSTSGVWRRTNNQLSVSCHSGGFDSGSATECKCPIGYFDKNGVFH